MIFIKVFLVIIYNDLSIAQKITQDLRHIKKYKHKLKSKYSSKFIYLDS